MVYDSYEFGKYLMELRRKDKLSMNVICDGICDVSAMSRIENGEKEVSKIVQDRLLGRLGVAPENYENMVFSDEYERWELRQKIISLIQHENMDEADKLLEHMSESGRLKERCRSVEDLDAKLEMQFYLSMKAQIMCYRHADDKELRKIYADAVRQTVTGFENKQSPKDFLANKKLSVEEINLLIEYGRYLSTARGITFIKNIVEYICGASLGELAMAKVYSKAVYYWYLIECRNGIEKQNKVKLFLSHATRAIECLRNSLRAFYLCELLDMKMDLISKCEDVNVDELDIMTCSMETDNIIDSEYMKLYGNTDEYSLEAQYVWCRYARLVLKEIYSRCNVREDTFEYSYIYVDREVYCIEDVIRIRRNMLKMSMKELSDGICSERTISRIERKLTKPQCAIVHRLFERLGLSGELSRTELISSDIRAQEMLAKLRDSLIYGDSSKVEVLLNNIACSVSMEIPQNKQILMRINACNKHRERKINDKEYIALIKQALECTLPYEIAVEHGEKYMTNEELSCINNIVVTKAKACTEMEDCYKLLYRMFQSKEAFINNSLSMYEFIMQPIASYMGDCGMYDEADEKENIIFVNTMCNRRLTVVSKVMYCMLWNDMQREKNKIAMRRSIAKIPELKRCLILNDLTKNNRKYKIISDIIMKIK